MHLGRREQLLLLLFALAVVFGLGAKYALTPAGVGGGAGGRGGGKTAGDLRSRGWRGLPPQC